jgi:hypothetical protein
VSQGTFNVVISRMNNRLHFPSTLQPLAPDPVFISSWMGPRAKLGAWKEILTSCPASRFLNFVQHYTLYSFYPSLYIVLVLSSIILCTHSIQHYTVYSFCPALYSVLILSSIILCTHFIHHYTVYSFCPALYCVLILSSIIE